MRIVMTTFGTLGDVNPLIALALELRRRGHVPVLAVPEMFRAKVVPLGIEFAPVRPDQDQSDKKFVEMIYEPKKGTERGLRKFLFPALRHSYDDLTDAVRAGVGEFGPGADLLLTGELAYAGPMVAEVTGIPWASYVLAPFSFFSAWDPPVLPPYPNLARLQAMLPKTGYATKQFVRYVTRRWCRPVYALRRELGLPRGRFPLFEAKHSERLVLALFSSVLGQPQKDWPECTLTTGFVFYDGDDGRTDLAPELAAFLDAGPPPLVFTLGSAAVITAGNFYEESAQAASALGMRAVLLVGSDPANLPKSPLGRDIIAVKYAPFSKVFPRASAIIHQGGVGTVAQALRAGKPMLIMPYSHDQPDNARRMRRLGVAKVVQRKHYTAERAARLIGKLLAEPSRYAARAAEVSRQLAAEDGLKTACDALEAMRRSL